MSSELMIGVFILAFAAFLAGWQSQRWRARRARKAWSGARRPPPDAVDQLRSVIGATFHKRRLMSRSEAKVFYAAEKAISAQRLDWRVMAQVSLGEILASPQRIAAFTEVKTVWHPKSMV